MRIAKQQRGRGVPLILEIPQEAEEQFQERANRDQEVVKYESRRDNEKFGHNNSRISNCKIVGKRMMFSKPKVSNFKLQNNLVAIQAIICPSVLSVSKANVLKSNSINVV